MKNQFEWRGQNVSLGKRFSSYLGIEGCAGGGYTLSVPVQNSIYIFTNFKYYLPIINFK